MIPRGEFEQIVIDEVEKIPLHFRNKIKNVVFVVEYEVSIDVRGENHLTKEQDLLGLYKGIPLTVRGDNYGVGMTLPDVITIYQGPTERAASGDTKLVRTVVRETVLHEVAHYLGMGESMVAEWEAKQGQHQEF